MIESTLKTLFEHYGHTPATRARVWEVSSEGGEYWCSCKPCFADGRDKKEEPLIERIPLDPILQGNMRGIYALPQVGSLVRVGFYGGDIHDPYLDAVLAQGEFLDSVKEDEVLIQHSKRSFWKTLRNGSWEWLSPKSLWKIGKAQSPQYRIEADGVNRLFEFLDSAGTSIKLDSGVAKLTIELAAGEKVSVSGNSQRSYKQRSWLVNSKDELLVAGLAEYSFLQGLHLLLGKGGSLQSPAQTELGIDESGLLLIIKTLAGGSLAAWLNDFITEQTHLLTSLEKTIDAMSQATFPTGTGPSGTAINQADFIKIKTTELTKMKASFKALEAKLKLILKS